MNSFVYFDRPLLIFDDKCSSCFKFAKYVNIMSQGWIKIAGHYYSKIALETKKMIFPTNYDSTKMFWLIYKNTAYGGRSALTPVIKEIVRGLVKNIIDKDNKLKHQTNLKDNEEEHLDPITCNYKDHLQCISTTNTLKRLISMMQNSNRVTF
jgi:hypothetical protein